MEDKLIENEAIKIKEFLIKDNILKEDSINLLWNDSKVSEFFIAENISLSSFKENNSKNKIYNGIFNCIDNEIEATLNYIVSKYKEVIKESSIEIVKEYLKKNYSFNTNFSKLLKNSNISNLYISIGNKNLSRSYFNNYPFEKDTIKNIRNNRINKKEIDEGFSKSDISYLIYKQGYSIENLFDNDITEKSIFLNSLTQVLEKNSTLVGSKITFSFKNINLNTFLNSLDANSIKITKESQCNLFNTIDGKIFEPQIILEKDFNISKEKIVDIGINNNQLGYSPHQFLKNISLGNIKANSIILEDNFEINTEEILNKITKLKNIIPKKKRKTFSNER